jgi:hypothetical protein
MASILSTSRFQLESDIRRLRWLLRW